jgi:hypothetical protein
MNPRRYLKHAEWLLAQAAALAGGPPGERGESECRSAISRSYYAAFLVAAEFLESIGIRPSQGGSAHTEVQHCLNNSGDADLPVVSCSLNTLYKERCLADYQMRNTRPEDRRHAETMVRLAGEAITELDRIAGTCQANAGRSQAVAGAIAHWATSAGKSHLLTPPTRGK